MELGGGGLMAARAANRMQMRQGYRTMSRMQRRRSLVQQRMGARQDFQPAGEEPAAAAAAPAQPADDYADELRKLADLRDQGVITDADFEAKKKLLLGL